MFSLLLRALGWPLRLLGRLWDLVDLYLTRWQSVLFTFRLLLVAFAIWLPGFLLEFRVGIPLTGIVFELPDIREVVGIQKPLWPITGFWFYVGVFTFVMGMCRYRGRFFSRLARSVYCTTVWMLVLVLAMEVWSRLLFDGYSIFDIGAHRRVILGWHTNAYWSFPIALWLFVIIAFWLLLFWKVSPHLLTAGYLALKLGKRFFVVLVFLAHGFGLHLLWYLFADWDFTFFKDLISSGRDVTAGEGILLNRDDVPFKDLIEQGPLFIRSRALDIWDLLWLHGWTLVISSFLGCLVFAYMRVHGANVSVRLYGAANWLGHHQRRKEQLREAREQDVFVPPSRVQEEVQEEVVVAEPEMTDDEMVDALGKWNVFTWIIEKLFDDGSYNRKRRVRNRKGKRPVRRKGTSGKITRKKGSTTRKPGTAVKKKRPAAAGPSLADLPDVGDAPLEGNTPPPSLADLPDVPEGNNAGSPASASGATDQTTDAEELRERFRKAHAASSDPFSSDEALLRNTGIDRRQENNEDEDEGVEGDEEDSRDNQEGQSDNVTPEPAMRSKYDLSEDLLEAGTDQEEQGEDVTPGPAMRSKYDLSEDSSEKNVAVPDGNSDESVSEEPVAEESEQEESVSGKPEDITDDVDSADSSGNIQDDSADEDDQEEAVSGDADNIQNDSDDSQEEDVNESLQDDPATIDSQTEPEPVAEPEPEPEPVIEPEPEPGDLDEDPFADFNGDDPLDDSVENLKDEKSPVEENIAAEELPAKDNIAAEESPVEENIATEEFPAEDNIAAEESPVEENTVAAESPVEENAVEKSPPEEAAVESSVSAPPDPAFAPEQEQPARTQRWRGPSGPMPAPRVSSPRSIQSPGAQAAVDRLDPEAWSAVLGQDSNEGDYLAWIQGLPGEEAEVISPSILERFPNADRWGSAEWSQWQCHWIEHVFVEFDQELYNNIVNGRMWGTPGVDWLVEFVGYCEEHHIEIDRDLVPDLKRIYGHMPDGTKIP